MWLQIGKQYIHRELKNLLWFVSDSILNNRNGGKLRICIVEPPTIKCASIRNDHGKVIYQEKCLWEVWKWKGKILSSVRAQSRKWKKEKWIGGGVAMAVLRAAAMDWHWPPWPGSQCWGYVTSFHPNHHPVLAALRSSPFPRWGNWGLEARFLAPGPGAGAWQSRPRSLCDGTAHVLGHQAWLPVGGCLRELGLCGLSVLILCLFMSFPQFLCDEYIGIWLLRGKTEGKKTWRDNKWGESAASEISPVALS